jgi:hypothetical protein
VTSATTNPTLAAFLEPFDPAMLEAETTTIYAVDADLRLRYLNQAWTEFARAGGASWASGAGGAFGLGTLVMAAVPEVLRPFYEQLYAETWRRREPSEHSYECSTPTRLRYYRMRVMPCTGEGLVVIHSLARDAPHPGEPHAAIEPIYRDGAGLITQCSHCRRVRRAIGAPTWDWVRAYVTATPTRTSHGLCRPCVAYYYP